jgi:cellulose synthase/poly-beta-1,6-N-acetylglucosamine synthase-like glycosyltransferase
VPIGALAGLVFAALLPARKRGSDLPGARCAAAILIPAHDEALGIAATLATIIPQLLPQDRLIVIADNCTDATAEVARGLGATVLERQHATEKGKGFALAFGMEHLRGPGAPNVVVMMDADCLVHVGAIDALIRTAAELGRPVQAVYLMGSPANPSVKDHLSAFAFLTKNLVRPRGLDRLGAPVLLTGTGMAFPWASIADVPLASGNIVEDMQLGVDLVLRGRMPAHCRQAQVTGQLPSGEKPALTQRKRWEHGHLRTLFTQVPRLLLASILRPRILPLVADLVVPPLALLAMLWLGVAVLIAAGLFVTPRPLSPRSMDLVPAYVHIATGLVFFLTTLLAWGRFGRKTIPLRALLSVPFYMIWKIPLYLGFLFRPEKQWVRTQRTP